MEHESVSVNKGVRHPRRMLGFLIALAVCAWGAVAMGAYTMNALGLETIFTGLAIGVGFPVAVIATGMTFLAIKSVRTYDAARRGVNAVARWTVSLEEYARFLVNNAERNALGGAYQNDWQTPPTIAPQGLEVVFLVDGVLVGDRYFVLVNSGMMAFAGVQILAGDPQGIEFGTVSTMLATGGSTIRTDVKRGTLRVPVARLATAEVARVFEHYQKVDAREIVVNIGRFKRAINFGLIAAPICFGLAVLGMLRQYHGTGENGVMNLLLAVVGAVLGIGALLWAGIAWYLRQAQITKKR